MIASSLRSRGSSPASSVTLRPEPGYGAWPGDRLARPQDHSRTLARGGLPGRSVAPPAAEPSFARASPRPEKPNGRPRSSQSPNVPLGHICAALLRRLPDTLKAASPGDSGHGNDPSRPPSARPRPRAQPRRQPCAGPAPRGPGRGARLSDRRPGRAAPAGQHPVAARLRERRLGPRKGVVAIRPRPSAKLNSALVVANTRFAPVSCRGRSTRRPRRSRRCDRCRRSCSRPLFFPHFLRRTGIHFVGKCSGAGGRGCAAAPRPARHSRACPSA
jgi:hypothetical protein